MNAVSVSSHVLRIANATRSVVASLECDERMHRRERLCVSRRDSHLASSWQVAHGVRDRSAFCCHDCCPRDAVPVHEPWGVEIADRERRGYRAQVIANGGDTSGVIEGALQLDAASVRQRVELMARGTLVDPHPAAVGTARPNRGERTVSVRRRCPRDDVSGVGTGIRALCACRCWPADPSERDDASQQQHAAGVSAVERWTVHGDPVEDGIRSRTLGTLRLATPREGTKVSSK